MEKKCYAAKIVRLRKSVRDAYERNLSNEKFWREVNAAVSITTAFRFGVSGDIYDEDYFEHMVEIAEHNKHCKILCFTKKYDIVNDWLYKNQNLPDNLKIIFSVWKGLQISNPFLLPEAHVIYRDGSTTASDGAKLCSLNCFDCFVENENCWNLQNGEQIMFKEH